MLLNTAAAALVALAILDRSKALRHSSVQEKMRFLARQKGLLYLKLARRKLLFLLRGHMNCVQMRIAIGFGLKPERLVIAQKAHVAHRRANARSTNPRVVVLAAEDARQAAGFSVEQHQPAVFVVERAERE